MFFPLCIELEDIEPILYVDVAFKFSSMGNLIFLLDQVKLLLDRRVLLELVLAHLEEHLNHVLRSLVDVGFMEDVSELVKDSHGDGGLHLL